MPSMPPPLLVALRFLQGLAVGGGWGGAALRAAEFAPPGRRGRWDMYPQLGPGIAFALASGTFLITGASMGPEAFLAWGWRVPSLVSVVLVGVGLYVRLRIAETPVFRELLERQERSPAPVREAHRTGTREILPVGGTLAAVFGGYIGTAYVTNYATTVLKVPLPTMFGIGVVAGLVLAGVVAVSAIGWDRFGPSRMILAGNLVMMLSVLGLLGVVCGLRLPETRHRSLRGATLRPALAEG